MNDKLSHEMEQILYEVKKVIVGQDHFLERVLELDRSWPILDLCGGQGRHSLELSRRGFQDVTVLDYSEVLINVGKEKAEKEGLNTRFVRTDARDTSLPDGRFRIIITMASSLGYFVERGENEKMHPFTPYYHKLHLWS